MGAYDLSLGVLLMGVFLNTLLFGFVTMQFITYYSRNFKDPFWIRLAVATMVVVDTFHSAVVIYMIWEYCVTSFNNPTILNVALWPYTFTPIGTALAAVVTHSFLSYRIYCLDQKPWVLSLLMLGTLTTFATGVACGIKAWLLEDLSKFGALTTLATCWLGLQMILDVVIASGMSYVLWKSKTGSYKMDGVVHRLIGTAIQIGVFCVIFAAGDLISFVVAPQTHFYGMFAIPLGRIYTNTLMNTLNMRSELKETLSENIGMKSQSAIRFKSTRSVQIKVDSSTSRQVDAFDDFDDLDRKGKGTMA